jgi:glycosyltransferase involved in cell wall biosynthesis
LTRDLENNKQLKISIVTPSYNQATFLPSTIRSIRDQNYPNMEYIIIDGGSHDGSVDIIRQYEKFLTYWVSEPDRGQSDAINKGWKRVTGDIVGYLNSDDLLLPGSLDRVSAFFEKNENIDFIYGNAIYINESGETIGRLHGYPFDLHLLLLRKITIPQPAMFFRKSILDDIGYLDENLHYSMDFDFWLRTAKHHTLEHIPHDLAAMRLHSEAKTITQQDHFYQDELKILAKFFSQPNLSEKIKKVEKMAFAQCYMRGADALFKKGQFTESRCLGIKGVRLSPGVLLEDRIAILCLSLLIKYDLYPPWVKIKKRIRQTIKR